MSFITHNSGRSTPNFLASEIGIRTKTKQILQSGAQDIDGEKWVLAGTVFPANDATAVGLLFENVNVTSGDMPGPVMTAGEVYLDRLPDAPSAEAQAAMQKLGMVFLSTKPVITRD